LHLADQTSYALSDSVLQLDIHFSDNDGHSGRDINPEFESESIVMNDKQGDEGECTMRLHFQRIE